MTPPHGHPPAERGRGRWIATRLLAALLLASLVPPAAAAETSELRRPDLRILVERHGADGSGTFVVYGDGSAIWNRRLQFRLSAPELDRLVEAVESARFREMPSAFGQGRKWIVRRVAVRAGGFSKEVVQLREGEQSGDLRALSDALFAIAAPLAREGITAASLEDGLRKVASGELSPRALRLIAHVKPALGAPGAGFLIRIEDGRATRQEYREGAFGPITDVALRPEAWREVAGILADANPATLPANLHSENTTELVVQVLDQRCSVLARRFSGPAPAGQDDGRERLARLLARLTFMAARPPSSPPSPAP